MEKKAQWEDEQQASVDLGRTWEALRKGSG